MDAPRGASPSIPVGSNPHSRPAKPLPPPKSTQRINYPTPGSNVDQLQAKVAELENLNSRLAAENNNLKNTTIIKNEQVLRESIQIMKEMADCNRALMALEKKPNPPAPKLSDEAIKQNLCNRVTRTINALNEESDNSEQKSTLTREAEGYLIKIKACKDSNAINLLINSSLRDFFTTTLRLYPNIQAKIAGKN